MNKINHLNDNQRAHQTEDLYHEVAKHYGYLVADLLIGRGEASGTLLPKDQASAALCLAMDALSKKKTD